MKADPNDGKVDRMSPEGCRPGDLADTARYPLIVDPEGDAQDVHRFSMRQDASSKNPGDPSGGSFELDLSVFFGDFL